MPDTRSPGVPSLRRFTVCNIRPSWVDSTGVVPITPILPSTTILDAAEAFLAASAAQVRLGRRAPATHRNLAFGLRFIGELGSLRLGDLKRSNVIAWVDAVGRSPGERKATCTSRDRCALASLKALLAWCSDRDACAPRLADRIHVGYRSQPGRALDIPQLLSLREALVWSEDRSATLPSHGGGARLLLTLLETGARISEVRLALASEVDLHAGVLRRPTSKNGRPRVIVLGPAVEVLERQLKFADKWLFPGVKPGTSLCYGAVVSLLQRCARRASIPDPRTLTPHDLRHTFATLAYELGCSIEEIAATLAHNPSTTRKYYLHNAISPGALAVHRTLASARRAA